MILKWKPIVNDIRGNQNKYKDKAKKNVYGNRNLREKHRVRIDYIGYVLR